MTGSLSPHFQKLRTFFDVFHMLAADNIDVEEKILIKKLVKTDLFTTNEAKEYIVKGLKFGQICEPRD
jgi:hypothetical protein